MSSNDALVQQIFQQYPGFKNSPAFKNGLQLLDATPERQNTPYGRQVASSYYPPGEPGGGNQALNPGDINKAVLEIYRKNERTNPTAKKELVIGEMLHGMKQDPNWQKLRKEFAQYFSPRAKAINAMMYNRDKSEGETPEQTMDRTHLDAYIRAGFMPKDKQSAEWTGGYTPQQSLIISKMAKYLKTGRAE